MGSHILIAVAAVVLLQLFEAGSRIRTPLKLLVVVL